MSNSLQASVAHMVAKLVARRATTIAEVPKLIDSVAVALAALGEPVAAPVAAAKEIAAPARAPRAASAPRRRAPAVAAPTPEAESLPAPPQPRLGRRAEIAAEPAPAPSAVSLMRPGMVRGVVKWFDPRARRGALRLPGCSDEVIVEQPLLDEMAIQRLYKGQEVEATLSEESVPRVVRLVLPGGAWQVAASGGVVHNRHARPVLVELKREALKRVAARAEAELVLGRRGGG